MFKLKIIIIKSLKMQTKEYRIIPCKETFKFEKNQRGRKKN